MPAVIDGRGDDEAAEKSAYYRQALVVGLGGLRREGKSNGGDESESGDLGFHISSKVGFIPWDEAQRMFIQYSGRNLMCPCK